MAKIKALMMASIKKNIIAKVNGVTMKQSEKTERKILWISFGAGMCFALSELIMAIYSHSQSVLMDAAFDATELVVIGLTLFLTPLFHKPITEKLPFGYSQLESVFVVIKGFMLISVTLGLSANSLQLALSGGNSIDAGQVSLFQLIMGIISIFVLIIMMRLNNTISSPTIDSEIYGWKLDVCYSLGMSGAFFASTLLKNTIFAPVLPYFDQIVAIFVVLFMLPEAIKMLIKSMKNMFLFAPEQETVDKVKEICNEVLSSFPYTPVFFDITRTGRRLWVCVYFTTEQDFILTESLCQASKNLNTALSKEFDDCTGELVPQIS
ncbi:MAG: cation transporter [Oscillospiraceae bacterium]